VIDCRAQPQPVRVAGFPRLEPARVRADLDAIGRYPPCRVDVEERRFESFDPISSYVEEAGAARCSQVLAPGCAQEVAADGVDVDDELARRLSRVQQKRDPTPASHCADRMDRI